MDDPSALLRASTRTLRALPGSDAIGLLDALDAIVWEADPATFSFTFVSAGAERLLGYPAEAWLQAGFWAAHVHPDDLEHTERRCRHAIAAGEDHTAEYRMLARDGRVLWLRDHVRFAVCEGGAPARAHGVLVDITREKHAQAELRAQRDLNDGVLDSIEALVVLLEPDGTIVRTNRAAERIAGRSSRALTGRSFAARFAREPDRARIDTLLARVAAGRGRAGCESRLLPRTGEERVLAWSFTALRGDARAVTHILATGTDLTERLVADRALNEMDHELRHAQRLDALGRLASGVAHDFHNVLTAILGFSDVLIEDIADRPEARSLALEIRSAAEQAALLTRQLTTLARKGGVEDRPVDPRHELEHMRDLLARSIGEDVVLDLQLDSGEAQLRCDPGQFTQLVLNLVLNARDAMPRGGRLTIATQVVQLSLAEAAQRSLAPHCVLLTVRDTGTGMDEATRARVFEPWFTTKGARGTGIGLATVHDVVRRFGGDIAVESAVGQGTRFLLWFPCVEAPKPPPCVVPATADARAKGTILLVEDDPAVRRLMHESLRRQGCVVIEAADGREAIARAAAYEGTIDLLVTDVIMPGMSGCELAERLERDGTVQRVLFVSGYPDDAMLRYGVAPHAASLLEKPFVPAIFSRRVREMLAGPVSTPGA